MTPLFPDSIIAETAYFTVAQDWDVPITGFFILSPKRTIGSVADFTKEEANSFMPLLIKVRKGMKEVLGIDDVYLFQNEDTQHNFHVWIFPRHPWMEDFGRKIQSVRPIMNYAVENFSHDQKMNEVKETVAKMKEYMEE